MLIWKLFPILLLSFAYMCSAWVCGPDNNRNTVLLLYKLVKRRTWLELSFPSQPCSDLPSVQNCLSSLSCLPCHPLPHNRPKAKPCCTWPSLGDKGLWLEGLCCEWWAEEGCGKSRWGTTHDDSGCSVRCGCSFSVFPFWTPGLQNWTSKVLGLCPGTARMPAALKCP